MTYFEVTGNSIGYPAMYLVPVRYRFVTPGQVGLHYCVSLSSSIWQTIIRL